MLTKHPEDSKAAITIWKLCRQVFLEEIKDLGFGSLIFLGLFLRERELRGEWKCQTKLKLKWWRDRNILKFDVYLLFSLLGKILNVDMAIITLPQQ